MTNRPISLILYVVAGVAIASLLAGTAVAQPTYSIDFQGPTAAPGGPFGISDGDILTPVGPGVVAPPAIVIPAVGGPATLGLGPAGIHGGHEVDALSYGHEPLLQNDLLASHGWTFSVDEFAIGAPGVPGPSVTTEGAFGLMEASADIFASPTPPGPLPAFAGVNFGAFDGNGGATPFPAPGLNLVEPNPPTFGALPDVGDNLDAWDIDSPPGDPVYFSLDSVFGEPFEVFPANTGTAVANAFVGGDVLVSTGAAPALYADSRFLGLNGGVPSGIPNTLDFDDLDALVLWDDGDAIYQPTTGPYSWLAGGPFGPATDMLLYSLRRNSALLLVAGGTLDALGSGLAITEGDILIPVETAPGSGIFAPGIFIPAEALGISTVRSGGGFASGLFANPRHGIDLWDDELDALDVEQLIIPEPTSMMLMLVGLAAACSLRQKRLS